MTIVKGQIESLTTLKAELSKAGITRFKSIKEINEFLSTYEAELKEIKSNTVQELEEEISTLESSKTVLQRKLDELVANEKLALNLQIESLKQKIEKIQSKNGGPLANVFRAIKLRFLKLKIKRIQVNFNAILADKTYKVQQELELTSDLLVKYTTDKEKVISNRIQHKSRELTHAKQVIDRLYPQIAGAVGENMVVQELQKLPDNNILFNDFSLKFDPPLYNKKDKDRIYSIQIDHLLITNAGIFIIETKNWSKESVANNDLRSPIKQIRRTSYALFVILNSNSKKSGVRLEEHHWGDKQIPIRNLIVMINNKPKEKFKFVQIKTLRELNKYVTYFDPIFKDSEVKRIANFLDTKRVISRTTQSSMHSRLSGQPPLSKVHKPSLNEWLKDNPGKGVNDYFGKYGG